MTNTEITEIRYDVGNNDTYYAGLLMGRKFRKGLETEETFWECFAAWVNSRP